MPALLCRLSAEHAFQLILLHNDLLAFNIHLQRSTEIDCLLPSQRIYYMLDELKYIG